MHQFVCLRITFYPLCPSIKDPRFTFVPPCAAGVHDSWTVSHPELKGDRLIVRWSVLQQRTRTAELQTRCHASVFHWHLFKTVLCFHCFWSAVDRVKKRPLSLPADGERAAGTRRREESEAGSWFSPDITVMAAGLKNILQLQTFLTAVKTCSMSTWSWRAGVSAAAISLFSVLLVLIFPLFHIRVSYLSTHTKHTPAPSLWFSDIFHSNKASHAAQKFDSFDQYSGKPGTRSPSRILAWGNCYTTMWWIIWPGIWGGGGSWRCGRRGAHV